MNIAEFKPDRAYAIAFAEMMARLAEMMGSQKAPIIICIAGGAALHIYTGARYSEDVDAKILARVMIDPEKLTTSYFDKKGLSRYLYYDSQYNDTLALMHQNAYDDAVPIAIQGVDPKRLTVKLLSPVDLAVSKLARFTEQDREDIRTLARAKLISARELKARALDALPDYVGNIERIRNTIEIASKDVSAERS